MRDLYFRTNCTIFFSSPDEFMKRFAQYIFFKVISFLANEKFILFWFWEDSLMLAFLVVVDKIHVIRANFTRLHSGSERLFGWILRNNWTTIDWIWIVQVLAWPDLADGVHIATHPASSFDSPGFLITSISIGCQFVTWQLLLQLNPGQWNLAALAKVEREEEKLLEFFNHHGNNYVC